MLRSLAVLATALAFGGLSFGQCPAEVSVTVRAQVPSARSYQWVQVPVQSAQVIAAPVYAAPAPVRYYYVPTAPAPVYAAPVGECGAAAMVPAGSVEYRYGPFGRLRGVIVR